MDLTEALIHISQCVVHVCMFVSFVVALVGAFLDLSLPASELSGFLSLNSAFVYFVAYPYWIVLDVAVPLRAPFFWLVYAYAALSLLSNEVIFSGSFAHQFCHRSTCSPRSGMEHVYSFCSGFYLPTVCLGVPLPWSSNVHLLFSSNGGSCLCGNIDNGVPFAQNQPTWTSDRVEQVCRNRLCICCSERVLGLFPSEVVLASGAD